MKAPVLEPAGVAMRIRQSTACFLMVGALGCGDGARDPDDSSAHAPIDWQIDSVIWRTAEPGGFPLDRVATAFTAGESIVVVAARGNEILVLSADGQSATRLGMTGEGPSEFRGLTGAWRFDADSILAWDVVLRRLSWLAIGDGSGRAERLELGAEPHVIGRFGEGGLLALRLPASARMAIGTTRVDSAEVVLLSDDLVTQRSGATLPWQTWHAVQSPMGTGARYLGSSYDPRPLFAVADDRFYYAHGTEKRIDVRARDGSLIQEISIPVEPRPLTREMREAELDRWAERAPQSERGALRRFARTVPAPDYVPAYDLLVVDDAGWLWARRFVDPLDDRALWDIFGRDGTHRGVVALPPNVRPLEIRIDRMLAVVVDELGAEELVLYSKQRN